MHLLRHCLTQEKRGEQGEQGMQRDGLMNTRAASVLWVMLYLSIPVCGKIPGKNPGENVYFGL
jgi:hypothetical protein